MKSNETTKRIDEAMDYMQNDTAKAIRIFDEILETEPENIEAINGKGSSLMKLNRMKEAESYFDYSLCIKKSPCALISKGIINKTKKDYEKSLFFYDLAIKLKPELKNIVTILKNEVNELMDEKTETNLNYKMEANILIKKGIEFKNSNRLEDALDCFEKAIKIDKNCKKSVLQSINDIKSILEKID